MKSLFVTRVLLAIAVAGCIYFYLGANSAPPWKGPFTWKRVVIERSSWVYADLIDFKRSFELEKGDECFALVAEEWTHIDPKDSSVLMPMLCPKKGAGWGDPDVPEAMQYIRKKWGE